MIGYGCHFPDIRRIFVNLEASMSTLTYESWGKRCPNDRHVRSTWDFKFMHAGAWINPNGVAIMKNDDEGGKCDASQTLKKEPFTGCRFPNPVGNVVLRVVEFIEATMKSIAYPYLNMATDWK